MLDIIFSVGRLCLPIQCKELILIFKSSRRSLVIYCYSALSVGTTGRHAVCKHLDRYSKSATRQDTTPRTRFWGNVGRVVVPSDEPLNGKYMKIVNPEKGQNGGQTSRGHTPQNVFSIVWRHFGRWPSSFANGFEDSTSFNPNDDFPKFVCWGAYKGQTSQD